MTKISHESCIFIGDPPARLLFEPSGPVRIDNPVTGKTFRENIDFTIDRKAGIISRTPGSAIPVMDPAELYPSENVSYYPAPNANAVPGGPDGKNVRFDAKLFFAEQQFEVSYETGSEDWPDGFFRKSPVLNHAGPFRRMVSLGDSITEGYNASGYIGRFPFRKQYAGRVADALNAELFNLGKNGASSTLLKERIAQTSELKPDLVTVAFGMNDLKTFTPEQYLDIISSGVGQLQKNLPEAVIVVVSPMSGNPEWSYTPTDVTRGFADILKKWTAQEKIVYADVYSVWQLVIERKGFFALTGNGVNHPNDFGHGLYAKTILAALGKELD